MTDDSKVPTPETKVLTEPLSTTSASRGSTLQKGGFSGVSLGPTQALPTSIQAMTPATPPASSEPATPAVAPVAAPTPAVE